MEPQELADEAKILNVIDMAFTFTAMGRIFEAGSKQKIIKKLRESFEKLSPEITLDNYKQVHDDFCIWFTSNIKTAEKIMRNGKIKDSKRASYGQAAKVINIVIKVYVYYCGLPNRNTAKIISPLLNGAVDRPIMQHIKSLFPEETVTASTIEEIDKQQYDKLQELLRKDIARSFKGYILPVQYDDIMWNRLNR